MRSLCVRYALIAFLSVLLTFGLAAAQADCPALVEQALAEVAERCVELERNTICYGNTLVNAVDWQNQALAGFSAAGDTAAAEDIARLETAALDVENALWGIAVLSLQANLPDTLPGQNVTFIAFGDVRLTSETDPESEDPLWDAPMQVFRFTTGIGEAACAEAPRDGLLVRAPTQTTVTFTINGIEVEIGSTALLRAASENQLQVSTLEGSVALTSGGETQTAEAGFGVAAVEGQPPSEPEALDSAETEPLPLELLPSEAGVDPNASAEAAEIPTSGTVAFGGSFTVPGNALEWVSTGLELVAGQGFSVQASGEVSLWPQCVEWCPGIDPARAVDCTALCPAVVAGPAGSVPAGGIVPDREAFFVLPSAPMVALLGRVGDGAPFYVGAAGAFVAARDGTLYFMINEDSGFVGDETGAFVVEVTLYAP